ncbi:MAG: VWA-like domain-containing protein [Lachnospiraceae bacterium]|nr:VWA-like domain-containing protein [Lachnospiraceae bacterium]
MENDSKNTNERAQRVEQLAKKVLGLARDNIVVNLRFLDIALAALFMVPRNGLQGMATDGKYFYYDPQWVLKTYEREPQMIARTYLHLLLHLVFFHGFQYDKMDQGAWDLAVDIAVENTILSMEMPAVSISVDVEQEEKLRILRKQVSGLTAEKLYQHFRVNPLSESGKQEWSRLFHRDEHIFWKPKTEVTLEMEQWLKISERVKTELKSFSKHKSGSEELMGNLSEATKERYDYGELLRRFTVLGEDMQVNDDEFDYIYYTYGLSNYGNMPLVEPLEYKDANKVKEFVIAIDTSASCKGAIVQAFLKKTYSILKSGENFFNKVNLHIIQCDSEIQQDTKITGPEEFDEFCANIKLHGFGATDFRPVFAYVEELKKNQEFENLKGLIYFTDGYGTYPEQMPDYDVLFAFLKEDEHAPKLPPWAIKVVLEPEELEADAIREEEALKMAQEGE